MTSSHCCSVIVKLIASRRIPALFTRMSRRPCVSTAVPIRLCAPSHVETSSAFAVAVPPAATISSTTACAGASSVRSPSRATPRSLTTTTAPSAARSIASPRPMPRPAPVTIATLLSSVPIRPPRCAGGGGRVWQAGRVRVTFLGHVGMFIETEGGSVLCDPWFSPAYFGSWFPFPRNDRLDVAQFSSPDYLYVSHLHKDHFDPEWLAAHIDT